MRSYLQWQGPTEARVKAVSLVAGTVFDKKRQKEGRLLERMRVRKTADCQLAGGTENSSSPTKEREREEERISE